jgi:NRPS condensation-like uncharacterized protein/acyl carrier protein
LVLQMPPTEEALSEILTHCWAFDRIVVTEDDRQRTAAYRQNAERERFRQQAPDFEEFIDGLKLQVEFLPLAAGDFARAAQMTRRINQFNATSVRRTEGEISEICRAHDWECISVRMADRFGDYGLVGLMLARAVPPVLDVDTLLMSCRAMGRGGEHRMLAELGRLAVCRGLTEVRIPLVPNGRNQPLRDFLLSVAAEQESEGNSRSVFAIPASAAVRVVFKPPSQAAPLIAREEPTAQASQTVSRWGLLEGTPAERARLLERIAADLRDAAAIEAAVASAQPAPLATDSVTFESPRTVVETELARLYQTVLRQERVGRSDSFFRLGGDSLLGILLLSRIQRSFSVELPLVELFDHPTVAGLAAAVECALPAAGAAARTSIASFIPHRSPTAPLSIPQERYWAGRRAEAHTIAATVPKLTRFEGPLDLRSLRRALETVVERHEMLRTSFAETESGPIQVIHPAFPIVLPVVDLRTVATADQATEVRRWCVREGAAPFDYGRVPLFRLLLFRFSETEHVLLFTLHHIVTDGMSYPILMGELSELYGSFCQNRSSKLPPLAVQYQDFARWQRQIVPELELARQTTFWREQLCGAVPIDLCGGHARPAQRTFEASREPILVPEQLEKDLDHFAVAHGATLYLTLLAAFKVLLYLETGQSDVVVTGTFANRHQPEIESSIGYFAAGLPLRTRLAGAHTFFDVLERVRQVTLLAHQHPEILYIPVMAGMNFVDESDLGGMDVFRILFYYAKQTPAEETWSGLKVARLPFDTGKIRQDLSLAIFRSDRLTGQLKYNRGILDRERAVCMRDRYIQILTTIAAAPRCPLEELLGGGERL